METDPAWHFQKPWVKSIPRELLTLCHHPIVLLPQALQQELGDQELEREVALMLQLQTLAGESGKQGMGCEPGSLEAVRPKSSAGCRWPSLLAWMLSHRPLYLPCPKSHYVFVGGCLVNVQALIGVIFLHPSLAVILV